ncbi:hypothetical protein FACS1894132_04310 [Clostridia bacterium]|nr:hypothetical protein FACS1894132_04310 [Clostridia bacterium]
MEQYTAVLHSDYRDDDGFAQVYPEKSLIIYTGELLPYLKRGEEVEVECVNIAIFTGEVEKSTNEAVFITIKTAELLETASEYVCVPCELKGYVKKIECNINYISFDVLKFTSSVIEQEQFMLKLNFLENKIKLRLKTKPESILFGQNAKYECQILDINNERGFLEIIGYFHRIWLSEFTIDS